MRDRRTVGRDRYPRVTRETRSDPARIGALSGHSTGEPRLVLMQGRVFGRIDADGDGYVFPVEPAASPARAFEAADADGDGRLTRAELGQLRTQGGCRGVGVPSRWAGTG